GFELARGDDRQTAARKFIDDGQHAEGPAVLGAVLNEIIGPDMAFAFRPKPDAGAVVQPKPPASWLFLWHFQPLSPPNPVNPLEIDAKALGLQQRPDPAIAVTAIGRGQTEDRLRQRILIIANERMPALCRAWLPDDSARATLRHRHLRANVRDAV